MYEFTVHVEMCNLMQTSTEKPRFDTRQFLIIENQNTAYMKNKTRVELLV